ncbi:hypothetical protein SERLA73DRAFT_188614, partial [Serpula lacrymans var. lacrymans S7.3]
MLAATSHTSYTDISFFSHLSAPMSGASMTTVSVTTRKAWKAQMQETQHQSEHILQDATVPVPPTTESTNTYREHHETDIDTDNVVKPV